MSDRERSLGWLAESAVQPRAPRPISVPNSSAVALRAALFQQQSQLRLGRPQHAVRGKKRSREEVPDDVRSRDAVAAEAEEASIAAGRDALRLKEQRYEELARLAAIGEKMADDYAENAPLVDFERRDMLMEENESFTRVLSRDSKKSWLTQLLDQEMERLSEEKDAESDDDSSGETFGPNISSRREEIDDSKWEELIRREVDPAVLNRAISEDPTGTVIQGFPNAKSLTRSEWKMLEDAKTECFTMKRRWQQTEKKRSESKASQLRRINGV